MSFRARLTSFFLLIVVVPMLAIGLLVFRLIGDSGQGKADARASGLVSAAASLYMTSAEAGRTDAQNLARELATSQAHPLAVVLAALFREGGLTRLVVSSGAHKLVDLGSGAAIAPGQAELLRGGGESDLTLTASAITAGDFARQFASVPGVAIVVRQGGHVLGTSLAQQPRARVPESGPASIAGVNYRSITQSFNGFGPQPVRVTILSDLSTTTGSLGADRLLAAAVLVGFLLLAIGFSVLALRALQGQITRLLRAAERLGRGDFTVQVPTEGGDEFAALGAEFNSMSGQLSRRLDELSRERTRLRESIMRVGQAFASNLDREALRELAVRTAVDAVQGQGGRLAVVGPDELLHEVVRFGTIERLEVELEAAEQAALRGGSLGEAGGGEVLSLALSHDASKGTEGVITVARAGRPFREEDRELLRSLASQATLALENVDLHLQVRRQAVTDDLTGLPNHGRFQDLIRAEVEQVRRYHHPLGLIMIDLDDFKLVNDRYGHQQGDLVLEQVARVLRDSSRETDTAARYGGEEMAVILPHTDLDGAAAIAERIRASIEYLSIRRLDGRGELTVTASVGVAAITDGTKDGLIAAADGALYAAKREGKNRTVRALPQRANVSFGE